MAQAPLTRPIRIFCGLFIALGLAIVGYGVNTLLKSIRTNDWPVTEGVIQSAQQKSHFDRPSDSDNNGSTTYSAEVTYTYQVGDVSHTGNKISIGQMSSSSSEYAQGILHRYPIGKKVPVHYSPDNPTDAVLETGIHGGTWICFAAGTVFTLFGGIFLQMMRARESAERATLS